jgi:hypothetical protein
MNLKITLTVLVGIFVAITIFYSIMNWYPSNFDPVYTWSEYAKDKSDNPKIIIFGSSHTGVLDTDYIQEYITGNELDHEIYNLSRASDYPTRRSETIGYITELKPEMILYGIDIRMFEGQPTANQELLTALQITEINTITPNSNEFFKELVYPLTDNEFFSKIPKSPKIVTLQTIKHFVRDSNQTMILDINSNRPFFNIEKNVDPLKDLEFLRTDWEKRNLQFHGLDPQNNREFDTLKELIQEMENKGIKVVIFATPNSSVYLDWISTEDKIIFQQMFEEIGESGTIIYPKHDTYADHHIWASVDHVVEDKSGRIYSEDIAKMILKEIEE